MRIIIKLNLNLHAMKKLLLISAGLFAACFAKAQPVSDNAVIPVSVTLNSILRLTVVTGGNIDFVVNTIDQYTNGIDNNARYTTRFTVSSSVDFDVNMSTEDVTFMGTDNPAHTMPLNNVGYRILSSGTGVVNTHWAIPAVGAVVALRNESTPIVAGIAKNAAGNAAKNDFSIQWELGTIGGGGMNTESLLQQSLDPDRYVTSVYLHLAGK